MSPDVGPPPVPTARRWGRRAAVLLAGAFSAAVLLNFVIRYPLPVRPSVIVETARDLSVALGIATIATVFGCVLLRGARLDRLLPEVPIRALFAAAVGYGGLGLITLAAAQAQLLRPVPLSIGAAGLLILGRAGAVDLLGRVRRWRSAPKAGPRDPLRLAFGVLLGTTMVLMLVEALAPPTSYDALRYHLRLPRLYAQAGGWVHVPYDFNAAFPANVDMLYALAFALGATGAAKLTHLFLGWLAVAAVAVLARRAAGPGAGLPAAAIFYTMPVVAINSAWAYVDMGLTLHTLLAVVAVWGWWRAGGTRWLLLAGVLIGLALGTKYTAAASVPILAGAVLVRPLRRAGATWRSAARGAAILVVVALVIASPWLVRNWLTWGSPVYPFATDWFGAPPGDTYRAAQHRAVLDRPEVPTGTVWDVAGLPWRFTMAPWVRDEMIGPALLVGAPLVALAAAGGGGGLLALSGAYGVAWLVLSPQVRLFLHGLGLLSAAVSSSLLTLRRRGGHAGRWGGLGLAIAGALSVGNLVVLQRALSDPVPVVFGMEDRGRYLRRMIDGHEAIEFINRDLPESSRILFVGEIYGLYCDRDYLLGSKFDRAPIVDFISRSPDLEAFLERLRSDGFTHLLYSMGQLRKFTSLPGRYLDWPDDRSRGIYREFMTRHLEVVFESPDAVVARIRFDPPASTEAAEGPEGS